MAATLKDIAETSGISIRTIRRVLNGDENVSCEKRELIQKLAKKLNYVPNINARNLRMQSSRFVGVIGFSADVCGEVFTRKSYDLERRLEADGFYPIMATMPPDVRHAEKILNDWSGMTHNLLISSFVSDELAKVFLKSGNRIIWIDQQRKFPGSNLQVDRAAGVSDAIKYLWKHGRRKILHCGNMPSREAGFTRAFKTLKVAPSYTQIFIGNSFDSVYANSSELIKSKCNAIFFDSDRMALGFLKYAAEKGIKIPHDFAVIGFDDDIASTYYFPSLSTVAHPFEQMNKRIVELIKTPDQEDVNEMLKTQFIPRETVE